MATEFKLPDLGENIEAGDVINVLVSVGDTVKKKQAVLELETDKAVVEVPSSVAGVIEKIHVKEGDKATVGQLLLTVSEDGAEAAEGPEEEPEEREEVEPAASAESEESKPSSAEVSTDRQKSERGEVVEFAQRTRTETSSRVIPASPSVRRLAREIGVDIHQVKGTGPQGRISRDDVKAFARSRRGAAPAPAATSPGATPFPDFSRWGEVERKPFSNVRRVTAQHMAHCWSTVPHVTQNDRCDVTALEGRRKRYSKKAEAEGGKLTVTAIILKVAAAALKIFPQFNASIDVANQETVFKKYVNVGIAVDTPRGLLVPVVRDADKKNILELSAELLKLAEKARDGKIAPEDLQGGTFTITNLGGIGGTGFSPIVNWPEVAILGVSRSRVEPIYENGEFVPRTILPLSLSYDHRLIDGADAARFLRWIAEALEDPFLISLEG